MLLNQFFKAVIFIGLFYSYMVNAQTLHDLKEAGSIKIKTWLDPQENIIARQQINLNIEIATNKRFSGGMQIEHFEIPDAIVLQREKFALNSTRNETGVNWIIQQWTLVIYPQRRGVFNVPAIPLRLSVVGEDGKVVQGEVFTQPFEFNATLPESVKINDSWVATNRFSIKEGFNKSIDQLVVGDALIRTINLSADNLPAMMLPEVIMEDIQGLAIYPGIPQLIDTANRGEYLAQRIQTITYVFEQAGDYTLPAQRFYWWNLNTQTYDHIDLEAHTMTILLAADADTVKSGKLTIDNVLFGVKFSLWLKLGVMLWLFFLGWLVFKKYILRYSKRQTKKISKLS